MDLSQKFGKSSKLFQSLGMFGSGFVVVLYSSASCGSILVGLHRNWIRPSEYNVNGQYHKISVLQKHEEKKKELILFLKCNQISSWRVLLISVTMKATIKLPLSKKLKGLDLFYLIHQLSIKYNVKKRS